MPKKVTIPVRLDPEQMAGVQRLAAAHDTSDAQIIRWSIRALLEYVNQHDGKLLMPFDFTDTWQRVARQVVAQDPAPDVPPSEDDAPGRPRSPVDDVMAGSAL